MVGLLIGVGWFRRARRADAYRSSFDLEAQAFTRPDPVVVAAEPGAAPRAETAPARRYRNRPGVIVTVVLCAAYVGFATWLSLIPEATPAFTAIVWSAVLLPGSLLAATWLTCLDIGPDGLLVRTPLRRHVIAWSDLAEVRWHRNSYGDVLLLVTADQRRIKAYAIGITDDGWGRDRVAPVVDHLRRAWRDSPEPTAS